MGGFQSFVNLNNPLAVEGDFASANPRASVLAGPGALVAGPNGVLVGRFAFVESDGKTVNNGGGGALNGFVHREQQALITVYLATASMMIPPGFPVVLHDEGDFWATLAAGGSVVPGATLYARYSDGAICSALPTGASVTGEMGASFTGVLAAGVLTSSSVTGLISVGDTLAGVGVTTGTTIVSQLSGTNGGAGTYQTSADQTLASVAMTSFSNVLNITAVGSGALAVGDAVTGTGIPTGALILSQLSGTPGGVGVYTLDLDAAAYAASTTVTVVAGAEINFVAKSTAAVGELLKISTWGN